MQLQVPGQPGPKTLRAAQALATAEQFASRGRWREVAVTCDQLNRQLPRFLQPWLLHFNALDQLADYPTLERVAGQCLQQLTRCVPAYMSLSTALRMQQRSEEALESIEKALALEPANQYILYQLGTTKKELRDFDGALQALNRCIALDPLYANAYWSRADFYNAITDEELQAMQRVLNHPRLQPRDRATLHYAIAKGYEHRQNHELQFQHIDAGAQLKRATLHYDSDTDLAEIERIKAVFTAELFARHSDGDNDNAQNCRPIFICGLPRSGTTLVEQILSSHPAVVGGDEIVALPQATSELLQRMAIEQPFPEWVDALTTEQWRAIGARYRELTRPLQSAGCFTDKNLQNYRAIGVIRCALPDARIVFCRRRPMDNIWGCYRQLFPRDDLPFTYSLQDLGNLYIATQSLLEHFQALLGESLYIVDYETLVEDQQATTRALLDYLQLPWDEACMQFYLNQRTVRTLSQTQVNTPINRKGIDQWQHFEEQLQPLRERLQEAGLA